MTRKLFLITALTPFILSGCNTLAQFKPNGLSNPLERFSPDATQVASQQDIPIQPEWTPVFSVIGADRTPTYDWVSGFGDPTLAALVDEAMATNTDIAASRAQWDAARANSIAANAARKPTVTGTGRISRTERGNSFFEDNGNFNFGLGASWEADLWGRLSDQAKAGLLAEDAARIDLAAARLSIAGAVTQAWLDLIEAKLLTDLAIENLQTLERSLTLTQRRFDGGVTSSSDVRLARSTVANAEATLASRRQFQTSAARSLEILLRRYPSAALSAAADLPDLPALGGIGRPGDIFARRPDLLAAERRLEQQGLRVDIARKALLPRLTLSADGNLSAGSLIDLFDVDALIGSIAAGLTAPIFQGGALKAEIASNEALLRAQLQQYAATALRSYLEVENALDAESRLEEREAALRIALDEAKKAEERLAIRYSEGLATILQLLDAQSRAINAQSALISARKERLANRVRLHLALGGGRFGELPEDLSGSEEGLVLAQLR